MNGSVVVITGASSGLGLVPAKQILIRATPSVLIVTAIDKNDLREMSEELYGIAERRTNPLRTNICVFMRNFFARSVPDGASCNINALAVAGEESRRQYLSECVVAAPPSNFVQSLDGLHLQKQSFAEIVAYVETVRPGTLQQADLHVSEFA